MAEASFAQTSFLGGELSKWAQGRFDHPKYKIGLSKTQNIILSDEGAATRRPGTRFLGTTRNGNPGRVIPFDFTEDQPYNMEFTDGYLRFWNTNALVTTNDSQAIVSATNANPMVFTLAAAVAWKTGDEVYFTFNSPSQAVFGQALLNRQFVLAMLTATTFTIADAVTGHVIGVSDFTLTEVNAYTGCLGNGPISSIGISGSVLTDTTFLSNFTTIVNHVAQIVTPYTVATNDWHSLRSVQGLELAMLLHSSVAPQALQLLTAPSGNNFATFSYSTAFFQDGPYLDPPPNAIATCSAQSGVIQVTVGYNAWASTTVYGIGVPVTYNGQDYISLTNSNLANTPGVSLANWLALPLGSSIGPKGFVSTDVGRLMRLFSAPQNWAAGTTYSAGNVVGYNGSYFSSLINSNTGNQPDISTTDWVLNPTGAIYTWGIITQVSAANQVSLQIYGNALLYTTPCPSFRMGAWSNTTGWPKCGCYQGGRFWFAGAIPNRVDASQPNNPFNMAPTMPNGTVTDASAISYTFNSNSVDNIQWMEPQPQGILIGTKKGEYLLSSGSSGGPITPTSIAESPASKYGTANVLPVKTGLSMCFVQRAARRLIEYLADVFSARFYGQDLTVFARHLARARFEELAYQIEPVPTIWARMGTGALLGITYRRNSMFSTQEAEFNAWHQHPLGSGRLVESLCVGPSNQKVVDITPGDVGDDIIDTLALVTNDPSTNIRFVESLTPMLDETDPLISAWFLDAGVVPQAASVVSYGTPQQSYVRFFGLSYLNGRQVSVFAAGLDCGDYFVENGYLDVPIGTQDSISGYTFDFPQFNILQPLAGTFTNMSVVVINGATTFSIPCVIGFNYQSKGQLCRPMLPQDTGARNGPGFGKKRRSARYAINLVDALGVKVGVDNGPAVSVPVTSPGGASPPYLSMFSGIRRETLPQDFSFDGMLYWATTRPYPATVTSFGGFITTEDV